MESFKIIDISGSSSSKPKKKLSKKQIYKEILSSSDKVQEIINNRKKTKRFDYLNTIPKLKEEEPEQQINVPKSIPEPKPIPQSIKIVQPKPEPESVKESTKKPRKSGVKRQRTPKNDSNLKDSKINQYFKPVNTQNLIENKMVEKAQQSIIEHLQSSVKKSVSPKNKIDKPKLQRQPKSTTIRKQPLRSYPKQFTQTQIKEIIKILIKLDSLKQYSKIHKTIRRLNKLKVNQLLYALRLIKKYSNAPDNMLKNTLFNYITSDIKVHLQ